MAFDVWVKSVPGGGTSDCGTEDMVPWGGRGLRDDPRFREVVDEPSLYLDYYAVLTTKEALEINAPLLTSSLPHWRAKAELLQDLLTNKTPSGLVVVCVYEWESGLGD